MLPTPEGFRFKKEKNGARGAGQQTEKRLLASPWLETRRAALALRRESWATPPPIRTDTSGARPSGQTSRDVNSLSISEIENVGAVFWLARSAESFSGTRSDLHRNFELTAFSAPLARRPYAAGAALELLSYSLQRGRAAAGDNSPSASVGYRRPLAAQNLVEVVTRLDRWGLVVLPAVVEQELCIAAQQAVLRSLIAPDYGFSAIYNTQHRYDYPLKLTGAGLNGAGHSSLSAEHRILQSVSALLEPALTAALGPDPVLVEFACVATFPGAPAQNPHSDVGMQMEADALERANIVSVFVYLDNVAEDQGALEAWIGTHKIHQFKHGDVMHHRTPPLRLAVQGGTVAMMDGRLLHRGTANSAAMPRLALYFSYMGAPSTGPEPLGSTFTMRAAYEDANTLRSVVRGEAHSAPQRGRWCFGNLNSKAGRLHAHYLFLACTPFLFSVGDGETYHVDALYDHERRYVAIFVDGVRHALESRWLDVEDGPVSLGRACHPPRDGSRRAPRADDYSGTLTNVWVGEVPQDDWISRGSLPPTASDGWLEIEDGKTEFAVPQNLALRERSVRLMAALRPSTQDSSRLHVAVTLGGDGSLGHRPWQVDCVGTPLVLAWSRRRLEPHSAGKHGTAADAAADACKHGNAADAC